MHRVCRYHNPLHSGIRHDVKVSKLNSDPSLVITCHRPTLRSSALATVGMLESAQTMHCEIRSQFTEKDRFIATVILQYYVWYDVK